MPIRYRRYVPTPPFTRVYDDPPPPDPATPERNVEDYFDRTAASGWGSAPVGGAWTPVTGPASAFTLGSSLGFIMLDSGALTRSIGLDVNLTDFDANMRFKVSNEPAGAGSGIGFVCRANGATAGYRFRAIFETNGTWTYVLERFVASVATTITSGTVAGVAAAPSVYYRMRFQVEGTSPTALRGRLWRGGSVEPSSWLFDTTNSEASLQGPGDFNIRGRTESGFTTAKGNASYRVDWVTVDQFA